MSMYEFTQRKMSGKLYMKILIEGIVVSVLKCILIKNKKSKLVGDT